MCNYDIAFLVELFLEILSLYKWTLIEEIDFGSLNILLLTREMCIICSWFEKWVIFLNKANKASWYCSSPFGANKKIISVFHQILSVIRKSTIFPRNCQIWKRCHREKRHQQNSLNYNVYYYYPSERILLHSYIFFTRQNQEVRVAWSEFLPSCKQ